MLTINPTLCFTNSILLSYFNTTNLCSPLQHEIYCTCFQNNLVLLNLERVTKGADFSLQTLTKLKILYIMPVL